MRCGKRTRSIGTRDRPCDGIHQLARRKRFSQAGNTSHPECLLPDVFVIQCRHEDDRKAGTGRSELLPQLNSRQSAKVNIEQEAFDMLRFATVEELLRRGEQRGRETTGVQKVGCGLEHARVVINDGHCRNVLLHSTLCGCAGELNRAHRALHRDRKNIAADLPLWEGATRMRGAYDYVAGLETLCFARRTSMPSGMLPPLSWNNPRRSAITAR